MADKRTGKSRPLNEGSTKGNTKRNIQLGKTSPPPPPPKPKPKTKPKK